MGRMPDRPSILFLNRVYPPDAGATGRMLRDLAQAFAGQGWAVTVLTTGREKETVMDGGVTVRRAGGAGGRKALRLYIAAFIRLALGGLRLPAHGIVVSMTDPPMLVLAGRLVARVKGARHMHWCQDVYPDLLPVLGYRFPAFALKWLARRNVAALNAADRVVAIGRCMARALMLRGVAPDRVTVIPNWPDCELAAGAAGPDATAKKFRVLYAGTLGRAHPVAGVLDAALLLRDTHPEVEFLFVGEGDGYAALARERTRLGLDNVRQLPRQPAATLPALMGSGDLHLIAMAPDAAGLLVPCKLYAALAAGRPVLLAGPAQSEAGMVIRDHGCGAVVPHDAPQELAKSITAYADDAPAWRAAARAAGAAGAAFGLRASAASWLARAGDLLKPQAAPEIIGAEVPEP